MIIDQPSETTIWSANNASPICLQLLLPALISTLTIDIRDNEKASFCKPVSCSIEVCCFSRFTVKDWDLLVVRKPYLLPWPLFVEVRLSLNVDSNSFT